MNIALTGAPFAGAAPQGLGMGEFLLNAFQWVFIVTSPLTVGITVVWLSRQSSETRRDHPRPSSCIHQNVNWDSSGSYYCMDCRGRFGRMYPR
jgi:hypothetical protein